ncbi:hypothetical protein LguiA_032645 [Lonicera macranthoides]
MIYLLPISPNSPTMETPNSLTPLLFVLIPSLTSLFSSATDPIYTATPNTSNASPQKYLQWSLGFQYFT